MKFEAFTPEVGDILEAIRAGRAVDEGCETVQRVRRALNAYNETMASNADRGKLEEPEMGLLRHFNHPGPPSALFARLLDGRAPLSFPPPTSFSYPWYALIEEPGPHVLSSVSGASKWTVESQRRGHEPGGFQQIKLDQCIWSIVSVNEAAKELLEIDLCFASHAMDVEPALAPFWENIKSAYAKQPEFVVRYGQWPAFRMRIGRFKTTARRDHALRSITAGGRVDSIYGPLDLSALDLNARMGEKVWHFDLPAHCAQKRRHTVVLNQESGGGEGEDFIEELLIDSGQDGDQQAIKEYQADPSAFDFVEFEVDAWVLEMAPETVS